MTGSPSILADLLAECDAHGIRLIVARDGGLTIDAPQDALTPDMLDWLKAHKADLLTLMRPEAPDADRPLRDDPFADWIEQRGQDGELSWTHPDHASDNTETIDPPDPCPKCGTLELWQTLAGNWRCLRCDPPTTARRLAKQARLLSERIVRKDEANRLAATEFFDELVRDMRINNSNGQTTIRLLDDTVTPCPRCNSNQRYEQNVGHALRVDCAGCGRFIDFIEWSGSQ